MRGKLKKLFAAVLAVLLALSFSGCSELTGLDAQALMSPPKTTADREAIYALMGGGVGDVTLFTRNAVITARRSSRAI